MSNTECPVNRDIADQINLFNIFLAGLLSRTSDLIEQMTRLESEFNRFTHRLQTAGVVDMKE